MMNAGSYRFKLNKSSLWHLWHGGTRLVIDPSIVIPRVVLLLDVSKWQGEIDFVKMKAEGVHGVIIKCGQGATKDTRFDENWSKAKAAGLPRGTYWFWDSRYPPRVQAENWWSWIKADTGELGHYGDYEESYGGDYGGWVNFRLFLDDFGARSRLPMPRRGMYTGYYYFISHSPTTTADLATFKAYPLWLAWYTTNPANVVIPRPWTSLILWQYGTVGPDGTPNGLKYGAESLEIDENNFNGDEQAYKERFGLGGTVVLPPIPPIGGTMKGTVNSNVTSSLNVRSAAGQVVAALKYDFTLRKGDAVYGEVKADNRIYFSKIYRANGNMQVLPGLSSAITKEGTTQWMTLTDEQEPVIPPPVEPPADVFPPEIVLRIGTVEKAYIPKP